MGGPQKRRAAAPPMKSSPMAGAATIESRPVEVVAAGLPLRSDLTSLYQYQPAMPAVTTKAPKATRLTISLRSPAVWMAWRSLLKRRQGRLAVPHCPSSLAPAASASSDDDMLAASR